MQIGKTTGKKTVQNKSSKDAGNNKIYSKSQSARKLESLSLRDIIDKKTIQPILEYMSRITNTNVGITDLNGDVIYATGWQDICTKFHRKHPVTLANCIESDKKLFEDVRGNKLHICKCKNNLQDVSTPIIIAGRSYGSLVIGQFIFEDEPPDYEFFQAQAKRCGFNVQEYVKALDKVPRHSREKIYNIMDFFKRLISLMSSLNISNIELTDSLEERNNLLNSLQLSEEKYRLLVENLHEGIVLVDQDSRILFANRQMAEMMGYTIEEITGKHLKKFTDKKNIIDDISTKIIEKSIHQPQDIEFIRKDGSRLYAILSTTPIAEKDGKQDGAILGIQDITARKMAEQALANEAIRRQILIEQSRDGIVVLDENGKVYEANEQFAHMLGYTPEEAKQLNVWDWEFQFEPERVKEMIRTVDEKGDHFETLHKRKDGSIYDVEISTNGAVIAGHKLVFCVCRDISARKQMEQALRDNAEQLENIVSRLQTGILIIDAETHRIADVNQAAVEMISSTRDNIVGQMCHKFMCPAEKGKCPITDLGEVLDRSERTLLRENGEAIPILKSVTSFTYKGREHFIENFINITERKKIEEERQRVEKLESIGLLAGGIAHDFNNILTGIMGNISLAKIIADPESDVYEIMQDAEKASLKAKDLTQQLLTFSKGGTPIKKTASIADLIKHTATFALRGSNVRCDFSIPDDLWNSEIDEGQISQVISNLVINAQQSMPGGGTIELAAENIDSSDKKNLDRTIPLERAKYVRITIEDHGTGIPPDHLARIFDPFFTTKQKGSGLGLATSYSIIRRHNGYITVDSKLGSGSTFYIYLPATDSKTLVATEESKPLHTDGSGKLLIMDDEQIVRDVAKRLLNHLGYENIDFATDGEEAIDLYEKASQEGKPYTLVILDLTIPGGMGGEETIKKLIKIDPKVNAVVSSGYSNEPVMSHFKKYGFKGAVTKPYTLEQLVKVLR